MFSGLFGKKQEAPPPRPDANVAGDQLNKQIENLEMRLKKLDADQDDIMAQARVKAKANDRRGAGILFKKKKMIE